MNCKKHQANPEPPDEELEELANEEMRDEEAAEEHAYLLDCERRGIKPKTPRRCSDPWGREAIVQRFLMAGENEELKRKITTNEDAIARKVADAIISGRRQVLAKLGEVQGEAHGAKVAAEAAEDRAEETKSLVKAHLTPRPADYKVTQDQLSEMLKAKNCPKDKRTIIRWEKYLSGNLKNGTKPPEGYTLQTRLTLESANAFVDFYCANEKSKLNTRISFEALTSGRNRRK